ncbi:hypothetical protein ENSA5_46970 [Enhygromyxa salina]|uniref:Uncharacterized protein n=1 Tax=Enhygromyxa salina TaxID=215803 RepID=A0A2S9XIT1_9BACT|nr:hypothetical protein [Enhygromyxa salina]PRP92785.1 hypothetical protein ENSA5_46970 [Enhygromyxa salina]
MAAIDDLIDDLRADGAVDSEGQFTLDREQARAKMQKFQLADPRRYVLELVQAAVLRGAETIEFEIDADDMRMRFDGAPFTEAEIDDLYGSLFTKGHGRKVRGVRQLALALNAALGMKPKHIHLRSGVVELHMRPGQRDEIRVHEASAATTELHVKQRLRPRLFVDFFLNLTGQLAEEQYLRQRCGYASAAIFLDRKRISRGLVIDDTEASAIRVEGPGFVGAMKVVADNADYTQLHLVKDGVWIDSRSLPECGTHLLAVVEGEQLRKDVSQAKIVSDDALARIVDNVRRARWMLWKKARDEARQREVGGWIRLQLLDYTELDELRDSVEALALAEELSWPDCRDANRDVSLRDLVDQVEAGETPRWGTLTYRGLDPDAGSAVVMLGEDEAPRLARVLGVDLVHADSLLAREQRRAIGRAAWLEREGDPVLPTHLELAICGPIRSVPQLELAGEVGVDCHTLDAPQLEHPAHVMLYKQRHLLGRLELELGIPNLWLVIDAEFEPNDDYTDAVRDMTFVRALLGALSALREPLARLLELGQGTVNEASGRGLVKRWLIGLLDPRSQVALLSKAGADLTPDFYLPPDELLPELSPARLGPADSHEPLAGQALFAQLDGPRLSLADIAAHHRTHGHIRYLPGRPKDPRILAPEVVILGPGDRKIVRALWGPDSCELFDTEAVLNELRHRDQPLVSPAEVRAQLLLALSSAGARAERWVVDTKPDFEGLVLPAFGELGPALEDLDADALATTTVRVFRARRLLCEVEVELGCGPLLAVIDQPELTPDESWQGLNHDRVWDRVLDRLRDAARELIERLCATYEGETASVKRWLARLLTRAAVLGLERDDPSIRDAIRTLDLFDTVSGAGLSLEKIEGILAEHGRLELVDRDTSWAQVKDPEIVKADELEREDLRALTGDAIADGHPRLRHRHVFGKLGARPPLTEATLDPARVFVIREVHGDQRSGEIGLSRVRAEPGLDLVLGTAGREVHSGRESSTRVHLPVDAIVIDERLPLDVEGEPEQHTKHYRRLIRQLRRSVPALVLELCDEWDERPEEFRREAWPLVLAHLSHEADKDRRRIREQAYAAARQISGFRDLWGKTYSLDEVVARSRRRPVGVLVELRPRAPARDLFKQLVLLVDQAELACLRGHTKVEELDRGWEARLTELAKLASAPKVERPEAHITRLVDRKAQIAGGLECELWIPRDYSPLTPTRAAPQLIFARAGRQLQRVALLDTLPCAGIVHGANLVHGSNELDLDARQRSSLHRQILILYIDLANKLRAAGMATTDHERGLEYLAWVNFCFESALGEVEELKDVGKRVKLLRQLASEVVPPTLRDALAARGGTPGELNPASDPDPDPEAEPEPEPEPEPKPLADPEPTARAEPARSAQPPTAEAVVPAAVAMPEAQAAPSSPRERLLGAVHEQLRWARERHKDLLDELRLAHLDLIHTDEPTIAEVRLTGIALHRNHPLVARLLGQDPHDPIDLAFVVATIYTLMNHSATKITDDDERVFVGQLAETLALSLRAMRGVVSSPP